MNYDLPTSVEICGVDVPIRYDYRVILEIMEAMNDTQLSDGDRGYVVLQLFYPEFDKIPDYRIALDKCMEFIAGGEKEHNTTKEPRLVSWEQDFRYIVAPVNRIIGQDVRGIPYDHENNSGGLHWWTFLSAYMEIGDCFFAQVVSIRAKKAKGKQLDKQEQEFYRKNWDIINIKTSYTNMDENIIKAWA